MIAQLIDGKAVAAHARKVIAEEITARLAAGGQQPGLAVILVGNDPASSIYVKNKREACAEVGIQSIYHPMPATLTEAELIDLVHRLNSDPRIDGILIQLPLPDHIDTDKILECVDPAKDVDGFHPYNLGRLAQGRPLLRPCTPFGVMTLLDSIKTDYRGKHAVVLGASNIVGRPMALELLAVGCTITVCHRLTQDLPAQVTQADILVSAIGNPGFVKGDWIKPGATVIDVGITRLPNGTITGDIEFEAAKQKAAWITPVPGGVGPMTVASLLRNTLSASGKHLKG